MALKILVTGKNRKIAKDICEHLEYDRRVTPVKSDPVRTVLFDLVLSQMPNVIIICLGNETADTIESYNVLKTASDSASCTTIVITNEEDEKFFMKYTELNHVYFLSRPVSLFSLYEKLNEIETDLDKKLEESLLSFREFENERSDRRYRRKQILVVDDDSEQLIHIKEQLEEFCDVTPVKSGEAAFKYLGKKKPDLILLDYMMPDMDGPYIYKKLRFTPGCEDIPVIFLTGVTEKKAILKTLTELRPSGLYHKAF